MIRRTMDRRTLLRGAGGVAIALPFLDSMARPGLAQAAVADPKHSVDGFPRRLLLFFSANGTITNDWLPDASFKMGRILSPLEAHKKDLLLLQGVHGLSGESGPSVNPHDMAMAHLLTCTDLVVGPGGSGTNNHLVDGSAGGPSIDQEIAQDHWNDHEVPIARAGCAVASCGRAADGGCHVLPRTLQTATAGKRSGSGVSTRLRRFDGRGSRSGRSSPGCGEAAGAAQVRPRSGPSRLPRIERSPGCGGPPQDRRPPGIIAQHRAAACP